MSEVAAATHKKTKALNSFEVFKNSFQKVKQVDIWIGKKNRHTKVR